MIQADNVLGWYFYLELLVQDSVNCRYDTGRLCHGQVQVTWNNPVGQGWSYSIYPIRTDARIMVTTCDNWTHGYLQWDSQCNQLNYIANNQQHYVVWHCCMLLLMCYGFLCREIVLWWFFDGSYCVCCRTRKKIARTTAQTQKIIHTYTHTDDKDNQKR